MLGELVLMRRLRPVLAVALLAAVAVPALPDQAHAVCLGTALGSDFNGDGHADVAVGEPSGESPWPGWVHVLYGTAAGPTVTAPDDQVFEQDTPGVPDVSENEDRFGAALASGDFNGDCRADLVIGAPEEDSGRGRSPSCTARRTG